MLSHLPLPTRDYGPSRLTVSAVNDNTVAAKRTKEPPPYGSKERKVYVPRKNEDFGDGGAFPEHQVVQYPLDMGRPSTAGKSNQVLAVSTDANGHINYDAVIRQGQNKGKVIVSDHGAMVPKVDILKDGDLARPDEEEIRAETEATRQALEKVVATKIAAAQPKTLPAQPGAPTFIKYTPTQRGPQYNSGATQRIIRMQDMPVDPLDPPKFRHKKVPRSSGSPPVPILHSPPRALSVKDQQEWKIPPCISNWKNPKGYTIPLDKRLAADGRGLQTTTINEGFGKLMESLSTAENQARQAVELRSQVQRELAAKEKEKKEKELRELAMRARLDRMGGGAGAAPSAAARTSGVAAGGTVDPGSRELPPPPPGPPPPSGESREERAERMRREEIREERRRERERERRLEAKDAHGVKKSKITRDRDRDVSEKIALGMARVEHGGGEAMYDQRLFNQEAGMDSGFGSEEAYNIYSGRLFADRGSNLYRHRQDRDDEQYGGRGEEQEGRKFKPDKGFQGVDYSTKGRDSGPVQFERDGGEVDPFGLDNFISSVRNDKKPGALDHIGSGGGMRAGGGAGSYDDYKSGSSRSKVDFSRGRG